MKQLETDDLNTAEHTKIWHEDEPKFNDFCRHSERSCPLNFEKWAKSEYVEENNV